MRKNSDKQPANIYFSETGMRLALLGPRMRRTLYRQDRLAAQGKLGSDDGSSISDDKSIISGSWYDFSFACNFNTVLAKTLDMETISQRSLMTTQESLALVSLLKR